MQKLKVIPQFVDPFSVFRFLLIFFYIGKQNHSFYGQTSYYNDKIHTDYNEGSDSSSCTYDKELGRGLLGSAGT